MNEQTQNIAALAKAEKRSVLARLSERYSVSEANLLACLKDTCFKPASGKPATNEQLTALCIVAHEYGLNPWLKQLYAFPDKAGGIVPVVGVDGWLRIINDHPQYDGMSVEMAPDGEECTVTIHRKDQRHPTVATEYLAECIRNTEPWRTHPRRMLRHKAIIQCARIAFGLGGIKDQDEAERIIEAEWRDTSTARNAPRGRSPLASVELPANEPEREEATASETAQDAAGGRFGSDPIEEPAPGPENAPELKKGRKKKDIEPAPGLFLRDIRGKLESVEPKNGETDGRKWTLYRAFIGGSEVSTFDRSIGESMLAAVGSEVSALCMETAGRGGKTRMNVESIGAL